MIFLYLRQYCITSPHPNTSTYYFHSKHYPRSVRMTNLESDFLHSIILYSTDISHVTVPVDVLPCFHSPENGEHPPYCFKLQVNLHLSHPQLHPQESVLIRLSSDHHFCYLPGNAPHLHDAPGNTYYSDTSSCFSPPGSPWMFAPIIRVVHGEVVDAQARINIHKVLRHIMRFLFPHHRAMTLSHPQNPGTGFQTHQAKP